MTNPTEKVEVTQADREAAADLMDHTEYRTSIFRINVRLGRVDGNSTVQAFARHRLRATPADGEPVAVIGKDWSLLWASPDSLSEIVRRTDITIGSKLYAHPPTGVERAQIVAEQIADEGIVVGCCVMDASNVREVLEAADRLSASPSAESGAEDALRDLLMHFNDKGLHIARVDLPLDHQRNAVTKLRALSTVADQGEGER